MRVQLRKLTTLILVAVGLLALPGLTLAAGPQGAAEDTSPAVRSSSAEVVLTELLFGWLPDWVEELTGDAPKAPAADGEKEPVKSFDVRGEPDGPTVGGVDDPAGPWA